MPSEDDCPGLLCYFSRKVTGKIFARMTKKKTGMTYSKSMKLKVVLPFLLYLGLAIIMTWPLAAHLTTHIAGAGGDAPIFLWDAWWMQKALFTKTTLWNTDYIFYPQTISLIFHTLALVNSFVIALLALAMPLILSFNLYFLLSIALAGWGMFLLVRYLTKNSHAGLISGIIFAFAPYLTAHWLGHQNLITLWFIPLFILCLLRATKENLWRWPIFAGILAGLASLNDFYNPLFLIIFLIWFIIYNLFANPSSRRFSWWSKIIAIIIIWLGIWSIWLIPALQVIHTGNYDQSLMSAEQITAFYSADFIRYFTPSFLNPFLGKLASLVPGRFSGGVENTLFLGYIPLLLMFWLVVLGLRKKLVLSLPLGINFWGMTALVFILLAAGPYFKIAERITHIPLPYLWLYKIVPEIGNFRVPARFSIMAMLALTVLAGIAINYLLISIRRPIFRRLAFYILATLILIEFIPAPYPIMDLTIPPVYQTIKENPEIKSLLDIPWGINSGYWDKGNFQSRFIYYATYHGKKIAEGSVSRIPKSYFDFYGANEPTAGSYAKKWDTDAVIIHKNYLTSATINKYEKYLSRLGFKKIFEDASEITYQKTQQ